ncbi:anthranilate phosphoribosyltransferase [Candidatus Oleimmundimicrobium sp.]|uniref:anthranilate phosphoribosyltransferase n=1 Tax=Candidatus Oleimmundimicrobium sp. TaxID=3060597 RepID=UPI0027207A87|nr:anthranilate phosphoribosyltransferase [Candidatus Oleimmundimicrobium sp.]MDO8886649.1 anthranilate phosphoribosyltransferase [Candidatus Oleimmundimicrobium sp.]
MIVEAIKKLIEKRDLTREESRAVMDEIMSGQSHDAQIGSFLTALRMKGETINEFTGLAEGMIAKVAQVSPKHKFVVDTCGTGGDFSGTFNISTISAFVAAGADVCIAKHGNRSISSRCGSADLLEALGVCVTLTPEQVAKCIDEVGIGFMFAPMFHPAMKHVMPSRKAMGIRTAFNALGPLTNPAKAPAQIIGVYNEKLTDIFVQVLSNLGTKHALVVHGADGLDELSTTGPSKISELKNGEVKSYKVEPEEFGLKRAKPSDILGGDVSENVCIAKAILNGEKGSKRDIVLFNSAGAIFVGGKASNLKKAVELAQKSIDSGAALKKLNELVEYSQKLSREKH